MDLRLSLLLSSAVFSAAVSANPQGAQVVHGNASFNQINANTLQITNSRNAIINWQQFGIAAGNTTRFIQPDHRSAVLNRVIGSNPSSILGNLSSNGRVFLINQHGLMVGQGAQINTAGFFGSTLNITNENFLKGNLQFEGGGLGGIDNKGVIQAGQDGNVVLIAPNIENSGSIEVENGNVILAAGDSVTISSLADSAIEFEVQSAQNQIKNLGNIEARNGAAGLFAGSLEHSGSISATGLVQDADGVIRLVAKQKVSVSGQLHADGESGGNIQLKSTQGDVIFSGQASAVGSGKGGGNIEILGNRVALAGEARLDVSGETSGGNVWVGGDYQGKGDLQLSETTLVGSNVNIVANAATDGDGGDVIVWAEDYTLFNGNVSATGGSDSGNGGFVEISGKQVLNISGFVDASASNGSAGTVLFDPLNLNIASGGLTSPVELVNNIFEFAEPDMVSDVTIDPLSILAITNLGTAIVLQAANNINVTNDIITAEGGAGGNITLEAYNNINIGADIFTDNGNLTLNSNADSTGGGQINLVNTNINVGTGNLVMDNVVVASGTSGLSSTNTIFMDGLSVTGGQLNVGNTLDVGLNFNMAGGIIEIQDDLVTGAYSLVLGNTSNTWSGGIIRSVDTEQSYLYADGHTVNMTGNATKRLQNMYMTLEEGGLLNISDSGDFDLNNTTVYFGVGEGAGGIIRHFGNGDITSTGSSMLDSNGGIFVNEAGVTRVYAEMYNRGYSTVQKGRIVNNGGTLRFFGDFSNVDIDTEITIPNGELSIHGTQINGESGSYIIGANGTLNIAANRNMTNTNLLANGTIKISNGATVIAPVGATGNTTISLENGTLDLNGSDIILSAGMSIEGNGTVIGEVNNQGGIVKAGGANVGGAKTVNQNLGTLSIQGNYLQGANGQLVLFVSDSDTELSHSRLNVSGNTLLGGDLVLEYKSSAFGLVTTDFQPLVLQGGIAGNFARVVDDNGTIYNLSFSGGTFSIAGQTPQLAEYTVQEIIAFLKEREDLLEELRRVKDEREEIISLILIKEKDEEEGETKVQSTSDCPNHQ